MSNIRVTYTGLIAFLVALISVITGTIFVVMVTRKLTPDEFGLWVLIGSMVGYVTIIEPIVTYWTTRQIARGEQVGKTAISTTGLFSIGGFVIYSIIAIYVSYSLGTDFWILILASALVPLSFLTNTLNSICLGFKPQAVSYGLIGFESAKIPLGLIFVVLIPLGIVGALIATIGASIANLVLLIYFSKEKIYGEIKKSVIKFWLKMSWLTMYGGIYGLVWKLDVLFFSLLTTSLAGLAYWGIAAAVTNIVAYSGKISVALYPKLIATGKMDIAAENLKRSLYFAIPILAANIVFVKPILHVINPIYVDGIYIIIIISFRAFVNIFLGFFFTILEGKENIDENKNATFKQYIHSNLFLKPTLMIALSIAYVGSLVVFLVFFKTPEMNDIVLVTIWAVILLTATIIFMIVGIVLVKKQYKIIFEFVPIFKYTGAAIITSIIVYYISEKVLVYTESIFDFIPQLVPLLLLGGGIYFGITYLVDKSTKILFNLIIKEIKIKLNL